MPQKTKALTPQCTFEDNTTYTFNGNLMDIRLEDCTSEPWLVRTEKPTLNIAFLLRNRQNVTLDFKGATLMLHGKIQPFLLDHSRNITIRNVVVQYDRPSFTEMTILEIGQNMMRVRLNPHHPCRVENGNLIPYSDTWENTELNHTSMFLQAFDAENRTGRGMPLCIIGKNAVPDLPRPFHSCPLEAEDGGDGTIIFRGEIHPVYKVGQILALGHEKRDFSSVAMLECETIHLENYRVINGAGMGILPIHTKDIFLNNVLFKHDERSLGIITNQADAIHAFACSGKFDIIDCFFEGMIDDALNIHGQFFLLDQVSNNQMVLLSKLQGETVHCTNFGVGDVIGIHKANTTEVEGTYTITELEILDDKHIRITLDKPAGQHELQSIVENLSAQADITIRNSVFQCANSHLRFQSSGKIRIENCRIELPVMLTGDASYWFESSGINDMEFSNTTFADHSIRVKDPRIRITPQVFPTETTPYYHKNIRFVNCSFDCETPIRASLADNIVFDNVTQTEGKTMTLDLTNCGSVTAPGCIIDRKTKKIEKLTLN